MSGILRRSWESYREQVVQADAPPDQVERMQESFYAGAQALYYGIMLSPGPEPTDGDEAGMRAIEQELGDYLRDYKVRHGMRE